MPCNGFYQLLLQTQLPLAWGSMGCWLCICTALCVYLKASFCRVGTWICWVLYFFLVPIWPSQRMIELQSPSGLCFSRHIASQNMKGPCCCTQLLLLLSASSRMTSVACCFPCSPNPVSLFVSVKNKRKGCSYIRRCTGAVVLFDPLHCFPRRDALHVFIPTLCIPNHNCSPQRLFTENLLSWGWHGHGTLPFPNTDMAEPWVAPASLHFLAQVSSHCLHVRE